MAIIVTILDTHQLWETRAILNSNYSSLNAAKVEGASALTTPGKLVTVTAAGVIGESPVSVVSGRVLIGATDNGIDAVQVGGAVLATSFKGSLDWSYIQNKPASYTPSSHAHAESDITGLTTDLATKITSPDVTGAGGKYLRRTADNSGWELADVQAGVSMVYSATAPTTNGSTGDIVFNSSPIAGGHVGWICLGGTTWKRWGVIDL